MTIDHLKRWAALKGWRYKLRCDAWTQKDVLDFAEYHHQQKQKEMFNQNKKQLNEAP